MNGNFLWNFDRGRNSVWVDKDEYEDDREEVIVNNIDFVNRMHEIFYDSWGTWSEQRRPVRSHADDMTEEDLERKAREVRLGEMETQRMLEEDAKKPFIEKKTNSRKIFVLKDGEN